MDKPLYHQLLEFTDICRRYNELYIYGEAINQKLLAKYLKICCNIDIHGYITTPKLQEVKFNENTGLILGLSDKYYNEIFPLIDQCRIKNLIFLPEYAKQAIARKMCTLSAEETMIEVNLVDHCNLNCRSCDHFSPIAKPHFTDIDDFERDIARLAELSKQCLGTLYLLGGEPLLNRETPKFLEISRKHLPNTKIHLFTNGILLLKQETDSIWKAAQENKAIITLTLYPIKLDLEAIRDKAADLKVQFQIFQTIRTEFCKYTLNAKCDSPLFAVPECYQFNNCSTLKNGKIYMCPLSAHIDKFNARFGQIINESERDFIDIYKVNSFAEIAEFLSYPVPFCKYCDIGARESHEWTKSSRTKEEYLKETYSKEN